MSARILIVEDEKSLARVVADLLRSKGYEVEIARDGTGGLRVASDNPHDLLILDVMLPGMSGTELCEKMRQQGYEGAILMLTAKGQLKDRVAGLALGADDYMVKPFAPEELVARVAALLRRVRKEGLTPVMTIRFGDVHVDFARTKVLRAGAEISLAAKEFELLRFLVNHRGQVLTRERLLSHVWRERPHITPQTVDVHIAWLRQKLETIPDHPKFIKTVRGQGYLFDMER